MRHREKPIFTSYDIDEYFYIKENIFDNNVINKYDLQKFDAFIHNGFLNFTSLLIVENKYIISKIFLKIH